MLKKKKRFISRKNITVLGAALMIITVTAGSVYAYLADADTADNTITVGAVNTEITENFPDPQLPGPGSWVTKTVSIENTGPNDCFVRVQILFSDSEMAKLCTVSYPDPDNWTYWDGWWYYGKVLKNGEVTSPVMDGLTISEEAADDDLKDFDIYVRQESVQSEGYDDAETAFYSLQNPEEDQ